MEWLLKLLRGTTARLNPIISKKEIKEPVHALKQYDESLTMATQAYPLVIKIVVPNEASKLEFLAALKYLHDKHLLNENCLVLNQLAHLYLTPDVVVVEPVA